MRQDENGDWHFRQSWLDTFGRCPEEARLSALHPDRNHTTDEAFIGTVAHAGIEAYLEGTDPYEAMDGLLAAPPDLRWTKRSKMADIRWLATECYDAWEKHLRPHVWPYVEDDNYLTEWTFSVPFDTGTRNVWLDGTIDLVARSPWDWKTSSRWYEPYQKQRWAVQPTVYQYALQAASPLDVPIDNKFHYGIMVKPRSRNEGAVCQHVVVERGSDDFRWLGHRIDQILALQEALPDGPWPMLDGNDLCSPRWCDHYAHCKGQFIPSAQKTPTQPVERQMF